MDGPPHHRHQHGPSSSSTARPRIVLPPPGGGSLSPGRYGGNGTGLLEQRRQSDEGSVQKTGKYFFNGLGRLNALERAIFRNVILKIINVLLPQGKMVGLPGVKYVFDAHTSKASERLKVVLLHL